MKSLVAAEAVVRNGSVAKAADELNLTSSAISQQLRVLEGAVKASLFNREKGKVSIKAEYVNYFNEITRSLDIIKSVNESLSNTTQSSTLTVSVVPSFATLCLIKKIPDFLKKHPSIKLNLISSSNMVDFGTENIDLAIRYTASVEDNSLVFEKIRDDYLIPCATKHLIAKVGDNNIDSIIKHSYLLDDISTSLVHVKPNWTNWHKGLSFAENKVLGFTDYTNVVNAGLNDVGAFIARSGLLIDPKLDEELVPLADNYIKSGASFYIAHSAHIPIKKHARDFKNWLLHHFAE
jgi:LysR family glycine cleavage system transcriptional activator